MVYRLGFQRAFATNPYVTSDLDDSPEYWNRCGDSA